LWGFCHKREIGILLFLRIRFVPFFRFCPAEAGPVSGLRPPARAFGAHPQGFPLFPPGGYGGCRFSVQNSYFCISAPPVPFPEKHLSVWNTQYTPLA
jgi:hypothetical protein